MQATNPSPASAALRNRAHTGMLFNVISNSPKPEQFYFWQGYAKALCDLEGKAGAVLAARDAELHGYQTSGFLAAAARCLDVDIYRLSRAEVVQRLAQAGIEVASDGVANTDISATGQLKDSAVTAIDLDGEHAAHLVDAKDDSVVHVTPLVVMAVDVQRDGIVTKGYVL